MVKPGPLSPADASYLNGRLSALDSLERRVEGMLGQKAELIPAAITSGTTGQHGWHEEVWTAEGTRVTMIGGRSGTNTLDIARMPDGSTLSATPTSPVHVWLRETGLSVSTGKNHEIISLAGQVGFARFSLATALATSQTSVTSCTVDGSWGSPAAGTRITVHNLPASVNFIFSGASGNKGLAVYDPSTNKWWIVQLQC